MKEKNRVACNRAAQPYPDWGKVGTQADTGGYFSPRKPSKLPMGAETKNRHRPPIAVIGRVIHELIVKRQLGKFEDREAIIGLHDGLRAGVDQLPVPHEDPESASGKELLCFP